MFKPGHDVGPNKPSVTPVDAWTFLMLCRTRFPRAIISIGWTTQIDDMSIKLGSSYSREMIDSMASLVKEYSLLQPVTFPVNGSLLKLSIAELQRLLYQVLLGYIEIGHIINAKTIINRFRTAQ